jgi:plasmid stability protein
MAVVTVRNLPDEIHRRLKERAKRNHHSLNAEIVACLEAAVVAPLVDVDNLISEARRLRRRARGRLNERFLGEIKNEGRP